MSKKAHMFDLIEAQHNSGLSNIDYCKQNNIKLSVYSIGRQNIRRSIQKKLKVFLSH
ncbi:hypothetical protein K4L44_00220 [Halosquirtibacter laminarini]|uniref:Uncharacterized protein n=1 Tax=Halosquirtibacter laminarini TaxID=3374600 RepID=A0AC61NR31_9BACT|nr:hypothetical protein K4L44_00220 [Prolixibacteraceae bacterium]